MSRPSRYDRTGLLRVVVRSGSPTVGRLLASARVEGTIMPTRGSSSPPSSPSAGSGLSATSTGDALGPARPDSGSAAPVLVSDAYRRYALGLLLVVYIFNFIDRQILTILAEAIRVDLGLSDSALGFLGG